MSTLVTYKIVSDSGGKLKSAGRLACNFWNKYVVPKSSIVIRLGLFTSFGSTIARSYQPYTKDGVIYGVVEFNTKYLETFQEEQVVGTIVHEIGHTLGFGWEIWMELFYHDTGLFKADYINALADLASMQVETDYDAGTTLSHWDEDAFDGELMTGFKDSVEYVLPVTVDVMRLLGHTVAERLACKVLLSDLLLELRAIQFSMQAVAEALDRDYFTQTDIWEEVYTERRFPMERP